MTKQIEFTSSPFAKIAADIEAELRTSMSGPKAQAWLLTANDSLGGRSPVQAIKAGLTWDVMNAAETAMCDAAK